ncbi:hypothetical protein UPYG_G00217570 [Umbra pygmaea]|uniref:GDNF/GAS1 domain-containing protein n=1 Tax=Umbra pygmaea TaxID=75934 RepID=A0ABD0X349_UMBPY
MLVLGILLTLSLRGVFLSSTPQSGTNMDCVQAERQCKLDPRCWKIYATLDVCASEALAPLAGEMRLECQEALSALHNYKYLPLLVCKCQRKAPQEKRCLRVYWTVRIHQGYDKLEESPYQDVPVEMSRMASMVAEASALDGQNVCLKAAQDCGMYEKCGALRSEYVLACTKILPQTGHCNRHRCHRALRRFLERVPEEYSLGVLFCPCTNQLCGERRRKTIVPSCSYEEKDGLQPNCLHLQSYCRRDNLCRSRLADFQQNCQPSALSPPGCTRETGALCLKSYAGLIGTIMTPNYVSNSSVSVALWCNCDGSGNQWQDCLRIQHMFTTNVCLESSISSMGSLPLWPVESIPPSPSPSPLDQRDKVISRDELSSNTVHRGEEGEEEEEPEEEEDGQFEVMPPYADKATVSNLGSGAAGLSSHLSATTQLSLLLLLLLFASLSCW